MENILTNSNFEFSDIKETLHYYGQHLLCALLIGSSIIAISKNWKKAMMNEELYSIYKSYKKMEKDSFIYEES